LNIFSNKEQVVVSELLRNSKADKLGISNGDILLTINGKSVSSVDEYYEQKLPFKAIFKRNTPQKERKLSETIDQTKSFPVNKHFSFDPTRIKLLSKIKEHRKSETIDPTKSFSVNKHFSFNPTRIKLLSKIKELHHY